jgi:hypothetical protein
MAPAIPVSIALTMRMTGLRRGLRAATRSCPVEGPWTPRWLRQPEIIPLNPTRVSGLTVAMKTWPSTSGVAAMAIAT